MIGLRVGLYEMHQLINMSFPHKLFVWLLFFLAIPGSAFLHSQNSHEFYYENEFNFEIPTRTAWAFEVGLANRGLLMERMEGEQISDYQHEHIEFNQFTLYSTSKNLTLGLGLRYRLREMFDAGETDEFRIIQQLEYEPPSSTLSLEHRLRIEQRFREATTYRTRYELEGSYPLNIDFDIGAATEALYAVSPSLKPEAEQRFSLKFINSSMDKLEIELVLQYRMENYTRDLENEYFVITELNWEL